MGSTGHGLYNHSRTGNVNDEVFGIKGAVNYKGKIDESTGLKPVGNNKVTLKLEANDGSNILFQFRLSQDGKLMTIVGYKNGVPEVKCKVNVDSGQPSLDKVMATGNKTEKLNAVKMKDLMQKSTQINENQLGSIANKLLEKKKQRGDK